MVTIVQNQLHGFLKQAKCLTIVSKQDSGFNEIKQAHSQIYSLKLGYNIASYITGLTSHHWMLSRYYLYISVVPRLQGSGQERFSYIKYSNRWNGIAKPSYLHINIMWSHPIHLQQVAWTLLNCFTKSSWTNFGSQIWYTRTKLGWPKWST